MMLKTVLPWLVLIVLAITVPISEAGGFHTVEAALLERTAVPTPIPLPSPYDGNGPGTILVVPDPIELFHRCRRLDAISQEQLQVIRPLTRSEDRLLSRESNFLRGIAGSCSQRRAENMDQWGDRVVSLQRRLYHNLASLKGSTALARRISIIVPDGARAYAMFLAPNNFGANKHDFGVIRSAYYSMCTVLGKSFAALWFSIDDFSNVIDRQHSYFYARKIAGLDFASAPFIVITSKAPQKVKANDVVVVLRLSGLTPEQDAALMVFMEQQLALRPVDSSLQRDAFLRELASRFANAWAGAREHPEFKSLGSLSGPLDFLFRFAGT